MVTNKIRILSIHLTTQVKLWLINNKKFKILFKYFVFVVIYFVGSRLLKHPAN